MNLPQETLGFRRAGFSPASRYSYRHSLYCIVHGVFRYRFCQCTMLLYRSLSFTPPTSSRCVLLFASSGTLERPQAVVFRCCPTSFFPLPVRAVNDSEPEASVVCFSPGHLRRIITRPVSYYALFKLVAASKPTSWFSVQLHILFHLTCTLGP